MPRVVDHDIRRQEVIKIACALIARDGIEATTIRRVAEASRCSTTVVSHYFKNKHELLLFAYREAAARAEASVRAILDSDGADLQGILEALLPLTAERRRNWHIWFEFWGMAVGDAQFAAEHRRYLRHSLQIIGAVLLARYGSSKDQHQADAQRLFALVSGIAAQAVFDSKTFTRQGQLDLIVLEIHRLDKLHANK